MTETRTDYASAEEGLTDLLGLSLLRAVERVARGGLLPEYETRNEDLGTPRGRLDLRHIATHPRRSTLRCTYDDLTSDHRRNQVVAAGLRLASRVMLSSDLRLDLARAADRFFGDLTPIRLDTGVLSSVLAGLDRRSSHYRTALTLTALLHQGVCLGEHESAGEMLASFTLNMNRVFERFLERYFRETAPEDVRVSAQDVRSDVFNYLENAGGWKRPTIRPDFVFRSSSHRPRPASRSVSAWWGFRSTVSWTARYAVSGLSRCRRDGAGGRPSGISRDFAPLQRHKGAKSRSFCPLATS